MFYALDAKLKNISFRTLPSSLVININLTLIIYNFININVRHYTLILNFIK